jgi:hypothetical protein
LPDIRDDRDLPKIHLPVIVWFTLNIGVTAMTDGNSRSNVERRAAEDRRSGKDTRPDQDKQLTAERRSNENRRSPVNRRSDG